MLRDPPRGVSSLKHILGSQTVKSHTEGWMLLTGLKTNGYDTKDVRNLDSTHDMQVHAFLLLKQCQGSRQTAGNSEPVSMNTPVSTPAQAEFLLWLLLPHSTDPKKGKGCPSQEECVTTGSGDSLYMA